MLREQMSVVVAPAKLMGVNVGSAAASVGSRAGVVTMTPAIPAVSVLMAIRNAECFIDEAIASVLRQTFADLELVLVDNGSSDGTSARIAAWRQRDPRVFTFRLERPGLGRSLNYAAAQARASVFARMDADDVAEPRRLEVQLAALAADPALGVIGSDALLIDVRGRPLGEIRRRPGRRAIRAYLAEGNPFVHSSVLIRRCAFNEVGGYRDGLSITEDLDLWLRLAEVSELDVIPEMLVRYRLHGNSMMRRQATRAVLAEVCIRAAVAARRAGGAEPFSCGCPQLRRALPLLGIKRGTFRRAIRVRLLRQRIDAWHQRLPTSPRLKAWVRSLPARVGLKPLFGWSLNRIAQYSVWTSRS